MTTKVICGWCKKEFEMLGREYKRQAKKGRDIFFCSISCGAYHNNSKRYGAPIEVTKKCMECSISFVVIINRKGSEKRFCSRVCASKGSVTQKRRDAARDITTKTPFTIHSIAAGLRVREWDKYTLLSSVLNELKIDHCFEYVLPNTNYIFDLALFDKKLLIEFDGKYHEWEKQRIVDKQKSDIALVHGWQVVRINSEEKGAIHPESIMKFIPKGESIGQRLTETL